MPRKGYNTMGKAPRRTLSSRDPSIPLPEVIGIPFDDDEQEATEDTEISKLLLQQREQVEYENRIENRIEKEQKSRSLSYVIIKNNDMLQLSSEVNQYIGNMYEPIGNVCVDSGMFYQTVYKKEIFGGKNRTRRHSKRRESKKTHSRR